MQKQTVLILGVPSATTHQWEDAFQQRGFKVISTSSPMEVTRAWNEAPPMLTVVDASLPIADSLRLCRDLRAVSSAPILLLLASTSDLNEAYCAGATECLVQPASPAVILLKALAWSMRSGWAEVKSSHDWTPSGSFFRNGLGAIS